MADNQSIVAQQAKLLYQQAPFSNATVIVVAGLMYTVFAQHANANMLAVWSFTISSLALLRLGLWYRFIKNEPEQQQREANIWINRYVGLTLLVGIAWGCTSIFYVVISDPQINTLFYVLISAVMAAAVPVLSAWLTAFLAYTLPQLLFLTSMSVYQINNSANNQRLSYFLVLALFAYFVLMFSLARRANNNIVKNLLLQEKNTLLLGKLNAEIEQREALVEERTNELVIANDKLRASQVRMLKLSSAVEASPNGVVITDVSGRIEYVNPKCEKISGYKATEVIGNTIAVYQAKDVPDEFFEDIWQTANAEGEWYGEIENQRKNGDRYWVKAYIAAVRDDKGKITNFVAILEDITESKQLAHKLSYQATHDQLTGLINRAEFERRLNLLVNDARLNHTSHVLCFLDLDQFKVINDTCGHIAGDELLRQLGHLMMGITRKSDTLARLGGDEFAILMAQCSLQQAERIANEVREMIEQFQFVWESRVFTIGVSIGVAGIYSHTSDMTEVLKQADTACYAAKNAGRNRVYLYQYQDQRLTEQQGEFRWVNEIKEALVEDRFELFVQPIVSTSARRARVYEVLIRLRDKQGQLYPPNVFLPSAERYNLSDRIDRWVLDQVFDWLETHTELVPLLKQFAVNLSGVSLGNSELLAYIIEKLQNASFPAGKIKFEITETAAIGNLRHANSFIRALTQLGCEFSLDDFGSGLSSFGYLKNLPVDSIKIDGMFVKDLLNDPLDLEMVKAINDIGHVMGLETIAEFVENETVWKKLQEIGVDYGQGYYLGKPVPIDMILESPDLKKPYLVS